MHVCTYEILRKKIKELERIYFTKLYKFSVFKLESDSLCYLKFFEINIQF